MLWSKRKLPGQRIIKWKLWKMVLLLEKQAIITHQCWIFIYIRTFPQLHVFSRVTETIQKVDTCKSAFENIDSDMLERIHKGKCYDLEHAMFSQFCFLFRLFCITQFAHKRIKQKIWCSKFRNSNWSSIEKIQLTVAQNI